MLLCEYEVCRVDPRHSADEFALTQMAECGVVTLIEVLKNHSADVSAQANKDAPRQILKPNETVDVAILYAYLDSTDAEPENKKFRASTSKE